MFFPIGHTTSRRLYTRWVDLTHLPSMCDVICIFLWVYVFVYKELQGVHWHWQRHMWLPMFKFIYKVSSIWYMCTGYLYTYVCKYTYIISYIHIHTLHAHIFIPVCIYVYEEVLGVKVREGIVICEILQIWFIYKSSDYIIYVYFSTIYVWYQEVLTVNVFKGRNIYGIWNNA